MLNASPATRVHGISPELGTAVLEYHENFADSMHGCLMLNNKRLQKHLALALLPLGAVVLNCS